MCGGSASGLTTEPLSSEGPCLVSGKQDKTTMDSPGALRRSASMESRGNIAGNNSKRLVQDVVR